MSNKDRHTLSSSGLAVLLATSVLLLGSSGVVSVRNVIGQAAGQVWTGLAPTTVAAEELTTYVDEQAEWSISYPADTLQMERLSEDVTIFISADRTTFFAVDTYLEVASRYGNTGENLRNRARDTLDLIYGNYALMVDVMEGGAGPWTTRVAFTTERGSKGQALYKQPPVVQPSFRVFGVIFGYKAYTEASVLPMLAAIRDSFAEGTSPPDAVSSATQAVEFVPEGVRGQQARGECWTNSNVVNRPNAWRCMVLNEIYDPCFSLNTSEGWVVCGASPMGDGLGFRMNLTRPLVVDNPGPYSRYPWVIELSDGNRCEGLGPPASYVGDEAVSFACGNGWYVLGDMEEGEVWYAKRARLSSDGSRVVESTREAVRTVWY
ncbi:MAG: hypothetical protein HY675_29160 [Chloroflexi bacterium]|nr:hypothetical protein [Chloroflexota bacterium]